MRRVHLQALQYQLQSEVFIIIKLRKAASRSKQEYVIFFYKNGTYSE